MNRPTTSTKDCPTCKGAAIVFLDRTGKRVAPADAGPFPVSNMWCCPTCDGGWDKACENGGHWEILMTNRGISARERRGK